MSNRAWMPLHIGDYLADTGHLTATEHGAYLLMIMHYWQNGSLPENERLISRIARLDADQWSESRDVLAMLFGENWSHKRIDAELSKADEIIEKRRSAANARHKRSNKNADAVHVHSKSSDTGALPITNNLSEPDGSDAVASQDVRSALWSEGLSTLIAISGKTNSSARAILGKWLKSSRDDCALVMSKITAARDNRVGDPIAWITAAIGPPGNSSSRSGVVGAAQRILEGEKNGPESVFGDHGHAQFLPPTRGDRQRDAAENLFGGASGCELAGNH